MNKIGFAIVGCGMISKFHANAIEALEDAYLAGVYDPVPASMERASKLYGVPGFESMPCWPARMWMQCASARPTACTRPLPCRF